MAMRRQKITTDTAPNDPEREAPGTSVFRDDVRAAGAALRATIAGVEGPLPPAWVVEFLLRSWRRYLVLVHHECGPRGDAWRHAVALTERLLLSIVPIDSRERRARLVRGLPALIADIKRALDYAQIDADERDGFLEQLQQLHASLFRTAQSGAEQKGIDLSDTFAMDVRDPRYRGLLDKLDGADSVEHIDM